MKLVRFQKSIMSFLFCTLSISAHGAEYEQIQTQWQRALSLGENNKNQDAFKVFERMLDSKQTFVSRDEIIMNMARVKYQDQKFEEALSLYSKISKSSDFWLQSLEEKAWTYLRQSKYENALALYNTLTTPVFAPQVGPEAYLIGSFSALKICDYKTIFDVFKDFKTKYNGLTSELEKLSKTGDSPAVQRAVQKLRINPNTTWAELGSDVEKLPQFFNRDFVLSSAIKAGQGAKIKQRIKQMAENELKDLSKIIQKLHIVEVEAIQRMNLGQTKFASINHDKNEQSDDNLEFPKEKNEVWLDEVTHYQVKAKGCQPGGGTKL